MFSMEMVRLIYHDIDSAFTKPASLAQLVERWSHIQYDLIVHSQRHPKVVSSSLTGSISFSLLVLRSSW